jgi:hypothetical protein
MGKHINVFGDFQSDKYPECPAGKVPLSVRDPMAQDLLWEYARRRRPVDAEFSGDLELCLRRAGYGHDGITSLIAERIRLANESLALDVKIEVETVLSAVLKNLFRPEFPPDPPPTQPDLEEP